MAERWLPVPQYEGIYEVSDLGRVRSIDRTICAVRKGKPWTANRRGQLLSLQTEKNGYARVRLRAGGQKELLHRLVLRAFVGEPPDGHEGAHGNGDKGNCGLSNLRWATHLENIADKAIHGTAIHGERSPHAKLTAEAVRRIRCEGETISGNKLAAKYGVSQARISKILRGKAWV